MAKKVGKKSLTKLYKFLPWLTLFLIFSVLYLKNLSGDIFGGDVGDLVTASLVGGVAHPPGYPLFLMLGNLFGRLPIDIEPVSKVGLVSVISSLGSLYLYSRIVGQFTSNNLIKIISTSILGLSYLFWLYTELPEVFALNVLLSLGVVYNILKYNTELKLSQLLIAFLILGLGLSNHHSIILLAPLILTILIGRRKELFKYKYKLILLPLITIVGLLPYLYLPIAASFKPEVNWNSINSLESLIKHILRVDYGTFSAGVFNAPFSETKQIIIKVYFQSLIASITLPVLFISLLGIIKGLKDQRRIVVGLLLSFVVSGPFFVTYAGFPLTGYFVLGVAERFYLLSQVLLLLFLPFGLVGIYQFLIRVFSKRLYAKILLSVFILIPIFMLKVNYQKTDLSKSRIGTNFAKDLVRNIPKNSVVFLSGDTRSFNSWYTHFILKNRTDIEFVQIGDFGITNTTFEKERRQMQVATGATPQDVFINTMLQLSDKRDIYSAVKIKIPEQQYRWIQTGLLWKLYSLNALPTKEEYDKIVLSHLKNYKIPYNDTLTPSGKSLILKGIGTNYSEMFSSIGDTYMFAYKDTNLAHRYYDLSVQVDPSYFSAYAGLARVSKLRNNCVEAEKYIKEAIFLQPTQIDSYKEWHDNAKTCYKRTEKAKEVEDEFMKVFNSDISKLK